MKYDYYKDKYKTISIKLDRDKDRDIIDYLDRFAPYAGPKTVICATLRTVAGLIPGPEGGGKDE
jgi:hypothetical protein